MNKFTGGMKAEKVERSVLELWQPRACLNQPAPAGVTEPKPGGRG